MESSRSVERTLLLVDDEENILHSLMRLFRRDGYRILTAGGGEEGLRVLAQNVVSVIVSDQRMPHMTGVDFLHQVKELYPNTVRMVLSGYTELESVTTAINEGAIYKFLTKPWDDELLRKNIREAFAHFELEDENRRLTDELQRANDKLSSLNQDLEKRVQEKTRELTVNLQALKIAQEVLENLPVGVIGVDSDGMIVITNRKAEAMLRPFAFSLIGATAGRILPPAVFDALSAFPGDSDLWRCGRVDCNGQACDITIGLLDPESHGRGAVMVMIPEQEV